MENGDFTEQDVRAFIVRAVADHWNSEFSSGTAILLSVLGGMLQKRFPNFQDVIGSGLKAYLSTTAIAQSVTYPGIAEKSGLIPNDAPMPVDLRDLFPPKAPTSLRTAKPSYQQDFWNAFFHEIERHRYVRLSAGNEVEIFDVEEPQPDEGVYEITKDDLVDLPPGTAVHAKADATRARIDLWLTKHGLDRSAFVRSGGYYAEARHTSSKLRALEIAFGHLSQTDQGRIMIPLDILFKIAN